jgi:hypothetical protein
MLERMVSDIGWRGLPGIWPNIEELLTPAIAGILEDEDLSEVPDVIVRASEETIRNARLLLKRLQADIFCHNHVIHAIAEASGANGLRTEAIFREYEGKAFAPNHIFIPFLGILRSLHSGGGEAGGLLEMLRKVEEPSIKEKVERALRDPETVRKILEGLKRPRDHH